MKTITVLATVAVVVVGLCAVGSLIPVHQVSAANPTWGCGVPVACTVIPTQPGGAPQQDAPDSSAINGGTRLAYGQHTPTEEPPFFCYFAC
jgi:hypothetical protein